MIPHHTGALYVPIELFARLGKSAALVAAVLQGALKGAENPSDVLLSYTAQEVTERTRILDSKAVEQGMRRLIMANVITVVERKGKGWPASYRLNMPPLLDCVEDGVMDAPIVGHGVGEWVGYGDEVTK